MWHDPLAKLCSTRSDGGVVKHLTPPSIVRKALSCRIFNKGHSHTYESIQNISKSPNLMRKYPTNKYLKNHLSRLWPQPPHPSKVGYQQLVKVLQDLAEKNMGQMRDTFAQGPAILVSSSHASDWSTSTNFDSTSTHHLPTLPPKPVALATSRSPCGAL